MYLSNLANAIRFLSIDAVEKANSGHPGMPMGMADIAAVLWSKHLNFLSTNPQWADRDRFVLSNGHGSMLLYSLLYLTGFKGMDLEQIKNFRQYGYHSAGHPELAQNMGIETTTGPLGQGIANGVGMALAERILNASFGDNLVDHHTYVFCGDGCLMEGISYEAISLAGHLKLDKLILFFDDNNITIDGSTDLASSENIKKRMESSGWEAIAIDGHDFDQIDRAIVRAKANTKPTILMCKTTIGYGSPNKANSAGIHGAALGADEVRATRESLNWEHPPFEIPEDILDQWHQISVKSQQKYDKWQQNLAKHPQKTEFERRMAGKLPLGFVDNFIAQFNEYFATNITSIQKQATRKSSGEVLEILMTLLPELVGGSADLSGSNNTKPRGKSIISSDNYKGSYIHYGIREHAMAGIMNGLRLHGGIIPYGGTFLTFSDYARPSIRLSALMRQKVIYVMTHDSIGLGEDGPTHQSVEHLMSLRLIPHLRVFRPCDIVESASAWLQALEYEGPSVIALSRQGLPLIHKHGNIMEFNKQKCTKTQGIYTVTKQKNANLAIIASGSEVSLAVDIAKSLQQSHGIIADIYSAMWLDDRKREKFIVDLPLLVIEAGRTMGWGHYVVSKAKTLKLGVNDFGVSAPIKDTYKHFGLTVDSITKKVLDELM